MTDTNTETFDILILGGGTASSLLASRLSTIPSLTILVLEAGQNHNSDPNVRTPGLTGNLLGNPTYDWQFTTSPEEGLNGRVIKQPRGKLWGGSSAINSHALVYPSRGYHDAWAELSGAGDGEKSAWDWEGVGKYYRRFQNVQQPTKELKRDLKIPWEGKGDDPEGIQASFPVTPHVLQKAWVEAIRELGCESGHDPAGGETVGGSTTTNAIDAEKGERSHAGVAFLEPALKRDNLVVRSNVLVEKIVFEKELKEGKLVANGVRYVNDEGNSNLIYARKQVILCAGTFGSPKVLELSGIGERKRLTAVGVETLLDLPGVGENLQDHLNFGPSVEVLDSIQTADTKVQNPALAEAEKKLYDSEHRGPRAEGAAYSFTYLPLQKLSSPDDQRQLDEIVNKTLREQLPTLSNGLKAQYDILQRMIKDPNEATATVLMTRKQRYTPPSEPAPGNYMTLLAMLSYPFSRGSSHIQVSDPKVHPKIAFNYLQHPLDTTLLSLHTLQFSKMLQTPSLSACLQPGGNTLPSGFPRHPEGVAEVEGYMREFAATNYHPAGTCAMMREELGGVVDEELRVYGTANVRVCDASVFPILPRGNILSTVYAVAEKGADIIRSEVL
ncbi:Dehydrogenase citC [Lachnellula suecica]|uniref:Dehydrogenase citC n=1 Tax=Lachnellula suecica TaxID=602035 RepID=A0A8T9C4J2_9HELO|nr:Dehydrogenase citC [Lachnellula suecica]